jgi:hypothetical protein
MISSTKIKYSPKEENNSQEDRHFTKETMMMTDKLMYLEHLELQIEDNLDKVWTSKANVQKKEDLELPKKIKAST